MNYYKPLIDGAVDAFGSERLIYGSNWSLSGLRGSYKNMIQILGEYCETRDDLNPEQLFYSNAIKAYGLEYLTSSTYNLQEINSQKIYPNPASKNITVTTEKPSEVELYTINGALLFASSVLKNTHKISVETFLPGMYVVRSFTSEETQCQKIIVFKN